MTQQRCLDLFSWRQIYPYPVAENEEINAIQVTYYLISCKSNSTPFLNNQHDLTLHLFTESRYGQYDKILYDDMSNLTIL